MVSKGKQKAYLTQLRVLDNSPIATKLLHSKMTPHYFHSLKNPMMSLKSTANFSIFKI
jgi:hypothetical protein